MRLAGIGDRWTEDGGLPVMALFAATSAMAVHLLVPPHASNLPLMCLMFAALGLSAAACAARRQALSIVYGILTGASAALAFQEPAPEGSLLGVLALVYGLVLSGLTRLGAQARAVAVPIAEAEVRRGDGEFVDRGASAMKFTPKPSSNALPAVNCDFLPAVSGSAHQFMEDAIQEIRLPLNTILGFAEILQSPAARDLTERERHTYPQLLLDCSRQLSGFVADIADMLRIDANHFQLVEQEVDAAELTEIAMKYCRAAAEEADAIIVVNVIENVELRCDAARIRRILVALVSRAASVSLPGTTIAVSFTRRLDGGLAISISDTGAILAPDKIERAFEPSLQAGGKDGLSLAIARRIARLHGGDVTIELTPSGSMSTFLHLPPGRVSWVAGHTLEAA